MFLRQGRVEWGRYLSDRTQPGARSATLSRRASHPRIGKLASRSAVQAHGRDSLPSNPWLRGDRSPHAGRRRTACDPETRRRADRPRSRVPQEARAIRPRRPSPPRQVRHRPDRHRRPPGPHGPLAETAAVPGPGPHGRHHHRQLHGAGRRPLGPRRDPVQADPGAGRGQRPRLPHPGRPDHRPDQGRGPQQRRLVLAVDLPRRPRPDPAR